MSDEGEAEPTTPEPPKTEKPPPKKEEKKGNWKTIGHEPVSFELYPCPHKWYKIHPKGPCPRYKQVRWIPLPLSDRLKQLALPLLRRLLALWLEFGDKFPPEMRARFMKFLMDNFGLTEEFLEQILEEARKAREKGDEKKKSKKKKRRRKKKKKKKKEKKEKKKREKGEKTKPEKKGPQYGLLFKRRKAGKLPLDWPYKMGSKLLLKCIAYLSKDPDEDYNSRASEYFDVQSMAILEQFCNYMSMSLPDPDKPTQYGEALVIMALNLSDWIAKYVTTPAQALPDDKIEEYLNLRGAKPKPPKAKKEKKKDKDKEKDKKKGKDKKDKKKEEKPVEEPPPEPETEIQRNWNELKAPVYIPEKSRISKRKPLEEAEEEEEERRNDGGYGTDTEKGDDVIEEGIPRWKEPTLDDIKQEFLEYIIWYNPWEPEFMYFGPRKTPEGVSMFKIWDSDSEEVPSDLRVLNWNQISYGFTDNYSFIPRPVPLYYPTLRPLRPVKLENLEKSGIPREVIKKNLRFFSPWYLMKNSLKPPPPPEDKVEEEFMGEYEEEIEDEMLESAREPPIKDSLWGDYKMKEQIEILGHLLHLMASEPDLTIEYVFEQLEEFCEAVECAEEEENPMMENQTLNKKRTIILEQYFLEFFGKKFRDYNDRTPYYMRKICCRFAYYIQLLYEHTARILWELQSGPNPPSPIPSRPETPDDPEALRDWNDWLEWLMRVTKTCDEWAGWISETVNEAEKKAAKKKFEYVGPDGEKQYLTEKEWFGWKKEVERKVHDYRSSKKRIYQESPYYLKKCRGLLPVKHRKVVCKTEENEEMYGESEYEGEFFPQKINEEKKGDETDETEWEDVGEVE